MSFFGTGLYLMALATLGCSERHLYRPMVDSMLQCGFGQSDSRGPLTQRLSASIEGDSAIATPVIRLHSRSHPSAVLGTIGSIVVNPIDPHPAWGTSHITQEVRKTLTPTGAHGNPTTAIEAIRRISLIYAALSHVSPHTVLVRLEPASRLPVDSTQTAATPSIGRAQVPSADDHDLSAITAAPPIRTSGQSRLSRLNNQTPIACASQVSQWWHVVNGSTGE